ncbi:hypothetical protein BDDG_12917 [Blastomyces dermatitidis ATCC 18188]|uniref:Uncharacterized protein n=2 Tax=Ajellomyces dermatitidis TaxID=5039 RepID=A0A0J9ETX6_AJEDA|nr:hypothetical protein BDFG_04936 [Blastomyces dermatitidis ATCC 26199]KMW68610.1 hypothetical protein BDDG_12917 [Blastomyces dermatitidis ATCC 18188]
MIGFAESHCDESEGRWWCCVQRVNINWELVASIEGVCPQNTNATVKREGGRDDQEGCNNAKQPQRYEMDNKKDGEVQKLLNIK